jgi:hypothetical protein
MPECGVYILRLNYTSTFPHNQLGELFKAFFISMSGKEIVSWSFMIHIVQHARI